MERQKGLFGGKRLNRIKPRIHPAVARSTESLEKQPKGKKPLSDWMWIGRALRQRKERIDVLRVDPEDFIGKKRGSLDEKDGRFDKATVQKHTNRVDWLENIFEKKDKKLNKKVSKRLEEAKKLADVLEAALSDTAKEIFGKDNVDVIIPSTYDDYVNGVDLVLLFREPPKKGEKKGKPILPIAVDITYAVGEPVDRKINRSLQGIASSTQGLSSVEYFTYENQGGKEEYASLKEVPRVVMGIDRDHAIELSKLWVKREKLKLANHPVARGNAIMIGEQLRAQLQIAKENGRSKAAERLGEALDIFNHLRKDFRIRDVPLNTELFKIGKEDELFGRIIELTDIDAMRKMYKQAARDRRSFEDRHKPRQSAPVAKKPQGFFSRWFGGGNT
jgi:hypothetical protein